MLSFDNHPEAQVGKNINKYIILFVLLNYVVTFWLFIHILAVTVQGRKYIWPIQILAALCAFVAGSCCSIYWIESATLTYKEGKNEINEKNKVGRVFNRSSDFNCVRLHPQKRSFNLRADSSSLFKYFLCFVQIFLGEVVDVMPAYFGFVLL